MCAAGEVVIEAAAGLDVLHIYPSRRKYLQPKSATFPPNRIFSDIPLFVDLAVCLADDLSSCRHPAADGCRIVADLRRIRLRHFGFPWNSCGNSCKAWLVQSIPTDLPHLRRVPGLLSIADVLQWLSGNATKNLGILAQYWQFLAQPKNLKSVSFNTLDLHLILTKRVLISLREYQMSRM
ncbi:hypothetical protein GUJ93_ZPchr0006g45011 [Zizania palustris]|uniref:Uncharacterized protein n=1 Tax=Zizania palustris TaxID=103762 RepID=A0A8J5VWP6_ZIZPA|nr:hypothetical protein GUJ93_ZPchr0006g45011 [Zizania palustris]